MILTLEDLIHEHLKVLKAARDQASKFASPAMMDDYNRRIELWSDKLREVRKHGL